MFEKIENALMRRGHVMTALDVWSLAMTFESLYRSKKKRDEWLLALFNRIYGSMSLAQSEIQHTQTLQALEKLDKIDGGLTAEDRNVLELCRQRCSKFEGMWWSQNRDYCGHIYNSPKGAVGRFLELLSNEAIRGHELFPEMAESFHQDARGACMAVGGCCNYGCGCCSRERMPGVTMHCTTGCGCCMARRGLALKDLKHDKLPSDRQARFKIAWAYLMVVGWEGVINKRLK